MIIQSISVYRVTTKLGAGGMDEVYRAKDTRLDREVAIKILPEGFADDYVGWPGFFVRRKSAG
jgi:serine/threonine protein kinase